jgi:IS5 family transposase
MSDEVIESWIKDETNGQRGRPPVYTETAMVCMATLAEIYHLPLRATEGLLTSIFQLMEAPVPVPDYTTLCRRRQGLSVHLPRRSQNEPLHLVVDSTGVKLFGEGEWKVRQHGYTKRRTWRKLHIGVDEARQQIVAAVVSTNDLSDGQVLPDLLDQVDGEIDPVSGDGAYDNRHCYEAIGARGARAAIPPQKGPRIWQHGNCHGDPHPRDENLRRIRQVGRAQWKRETDYHRRSLAETQMFRLKITFGDKVSARSFDGQATQLLIRCAALNRMTLLGMPQSYAV